MTTELPTTSDAAPRPLLGLGLLAMAAVGLWLTLTAYQTPAMKECARLYRATTTLAEQARVDATVPRLSGNQGAEAHSCGFVRKSARWKL